MMRSPPLSRAALVLPLAIVLACGDSAEPLVPTTLEVEEAVLTLDGIGATSRIVVTVLDQNGDPLPDVEATFQSRDQSVAEVNLSGLVTAIEDGSTEIVVRAESTETEVEITVEAELTDGVPVTGLAGDEAIKKLAPSAAELQKKQKRGGASSGAAASGGIQSMLAAVLFLSPAPFLAGPGAVGAMIDYPALGVELPVLLWAMNGHPLGCT